MPETPKFRIHTVTEMTGVPAATLRAWERRYGFPQPERNADNAYRLYTQKEVELVRRMVQLTGNGLAPSEAAAVVQGEADDWATVGSSLPASADVESASIEAILARAINHDAEGLERAVQSALTLGGAVEVYESVYRPALERIGEEWQSGRLAISSEHLAAQVIGDALNQLIRLSLVRNTDGHVLLACVCEEQHTLPLLGVALHLARANYKPVILGARTPADAVASAVSAVRPKALILSMTMPCEGDAAEIFGGYAQAASPVPWFAGGRAADSHRAFVEAAGGRVVDSADALPYALR